MPYYREGTEQNTRGDERQGRIPALRSFGGVKGEGKARTRAESASRGTVADMRYAFVRSSDRSLAIVAVLTLEWHRANTGGLQRITAVFIERFRSKTRSLVIVL